MLFLLPKAIFLPGIITFLPAEGMQTKKSYLGRSFLVDHQKKTWQRQVVPVIKRLSRHDTSPGESHGQRPPQFTDWT
jgi:hypothetical protein